MKLTARTCWSHVLHIMSCGPLLAECVSKFEFTTPRFDYEGMAGYIETDITVEIKDLVRFADLYDSWYRLSSDTRTRLYTKAKNETTSKVLC